MKKIIELRKEVAELFAQKRNLGLGLSGLDVEELKKRNNRIDEIDAKINALKIQIDELEEQERSASQGLAHAVAGAGIDGAPLTKEAEDEIYLRAWAKHYLQRPLTRQERTVFNKVNLRAEGTAITTTATTYSAPSAEADGVNNGGVFIPSSISLAVLESLQKTSPFYNRIRRIYIRGNVNFPYEDSNSGAKWYAEGTATEDQSIKFSTLQLSGYELAKFIRITWKLESMSVDGFISYITTELTRECGKALIKAVLYGGGAEKNEPTGAVVGALRPKVDAAKDGEYVDILKALEAAPGQFETTDAGFDPDEGAIYFMSKSAYRELAFAKNSNGDYIFNPTTRITNFGAADIEIEPYLKAGDIIYGNPINYILNEQEPLGTSKEQDIKHRRNGYSAYGIYDGKPLPKSFVYLQKVEAPEEE